MKRAVAHLLHALSRWLLLETAGADVKTKGKIIDGEEFA
jgi:hypothetical protein